MTLPRGVPDVEKYCRQVYSLFFDYQWVYNFKGTEILLKHNLSSIPVTFVEEFRTLSEDQLLRMLHREIQEGFSDPLKQFIRRCADCVLSEDNFLNEWECSESTSNSQLLSAVSVPRKWTRKKFEEVSHLSSFLGEQCNSNDCHVVVDIGSGLGYLANTLSDRYNLSVIAIESRAERVDSANRHCATSSKGAKMGFGVSKVQHVHLELTSQMPSQLTSLEELKECKSFCVAGLHSCGDLTPWSLQLFVQNECTNILCIVPCCYHKMDLTTDASNFPMSFCFQEELKTYDPETQFLQGYQFCRLASQRCGENFLNDVAFETQRVYYRALLELYVQEENYELVKQKRKGTSLHGSLENYVESSIGTGGTYAIKNTEITYQEHLEKVKNLHSKMNIWWKPVSAIIAMQGALQNIAEQLILIDRLNFLLESGKVELAKIVRVIPKSVSPRGHVIFATKRKYRMKWFFRLAFIRSRNTFTSSANYSTRGKSKLGDLLLTMPTERNHLPQLKKGREKKKEVMLRYPAGHVNLQILGNGSNGTPASLYVFADQARYLFNCGEGTQRLAHEYKTKLSKLEHIFVTNKTWDKIGGLPGVTLTIQDIGVPSITLHGPPGLEHLFEATRRFVILNDLKISVADCSPGKVVSDNVLRVEYVLLHRKVDAQDSQESTSNSSEGSNVEDDIDYYTPIKGAKRHLEITMEEGCKRTKVEEDEPRPRDSGVVTSYICRPHKKEGSLLIDRCIDSGVPPGPLLGKLKSGQDITLPNGRVVKADDMKSPDCPGIIFIVVDCPTEDYLDSLLENEQFKPYQTAENEIDSAHIVIHFTPSDVLQHPKYKEWIQRFRMHTQHLLINDLCDGVSFEALHRIQQKLNLLDERMFPLLKSEEEHDWSNETEVTLKPKPSCLEDLDVPFIVGQTLMKYNIRPNSGLDLSSIVKLTPSVYINETLETEGVPEELQKLKTSLPVVSSKESEEEYPKVIFLGTGSCIPNKTRNTSAIVVHMNPESCILLDCGEGTYGQIYRFFGDAGSKDVLLKMNAIYISHMHADHHIGLIEVLKARERAIISSGDPFTPVILVAPLQLTNWLNLYHKCFEKIRHLYHLVPAGTMYFDSVLPEKNECVEKLMEPLELVRFDTVLVKHCPNAFGVALRHKSGWKLTYSGDTMPCDSLVDLGKDSDILIHEATMEDELKHEAVIKQHSTTEQAIEQGKQMGAKFILLTHFSQRYAKVPRINDQLDHNVGIAFDNMCVRMSDLSKIPVMYPALKAMFAEHCYEMETRTAKKLRRRELERESMFEAKSSAVKISI